MLELFVLGIIAFLLIYRLWSVLGQRTGFHPPHLKDSASSGHPQTQAKSRLKKQKQSAEEIPGPFKKEIQKIRTWDADFTLKDFLEGASNAFELILISYAKGDTQMLEGLLSPPLFKSFSEAIQERLQAQKTLETTLVRISSLTALNFQIEGSMAFITVKFISEQTHILRDKKGEILEGSPHQIEENEDVWTFSRDLKSQDPNWVLVKTST